MFRADWNWWASSAPAPGPSGPGGPQGLIGPDGACPEAAAAPAPRGVALGMSECDLVRLAGPTTGIEIGINERGERTAVLTYPQGERAGTYRFTAGQLVSVERAPEPPPKPARAARPRKPS